MGTNSFQHDNEMMLLLLLLSLLLFITVVRRPIQSANQFLLFTEQLPCNLYVNLYIAGRNHTYPHHRMNTKKESKLANLCWSIERLNRISRSFIMPDATVYHIWSLSTNQISMHFDVLFMFNHRPGSYIPNSLVTSNRGRKKTLLHVFSLKHGWYEFCFYSCIQVKRILNLLSSICRLTFYSIFPC